MLDNDEQFDEYYDDGRLTEDELADVFDEYKRKQLMEHLVGPIVSTVIHTVFIICLVAFLVFSPQEDQVDIEAQVVDEEIVDLVEPEDVEEPEEQEDAPTDSPSPDVTTPAIETDADDISMEDISDEVAETDDSLDMEEVSDVVALDTPLKSSALYGGRSSEGKASAVREFGGSKKGQDALIRALNWLRDHQNPDGSWSSNKQEHGAMTGLAILTFLAYGETPQSKRYGNCVKKGIEALVRVAPDQKVLYKSHGYPNAIVGYALAEAYGMTGISDVRTAMDTCLDRMIKGQQDNGMFHYLYGAEKQDLSISGWNFQALKAAYAAGCDLDGLPESLKKSINGLDACALKNMPYRWKDGSRGGKTSMRAVGTLCLQLLGEGDKPNAQKFGKMIMEKDLPGLSWEKRNLYSWYYSTQAAFHRGGNDWIAWNKKFEPILIKNQKSDGHWEYGSNPHGLDEVGRQIYATTLCALMLTVYYRYLPSYKVPKANKNANAVEEEEGADTEAALGLKIE